MLYTTVIPVILQKMRCRRRDYDMLDVPTDPEKTIQFLEFDYSCNFKAKAFVWLFADSAYSDIQYLAECPCRWQLNRKVQNLVLISNTQLQPECVQTSVVYEEPASG